ncbi:MAG: hypothetical protein KF730_04505 [Sphingomonas sp.]|uniref:hypothetical protein n=1 Tax=Sphingomonas sp. TaxID=28214 RepID=UPI0025F6370C|nr:hypothetical protein [Sphingomonas sp.]MBX3563821.1 hypothetical protein [Sphingomonas sp.]
MSLGVLALALTLMLQNAETPIKIAEGGFCIGLGWISADSSPDLIVEEGPDFAVYRYREKGTEWGIYSGGFSQVRDGERKLLFRRDGVTVSAMIVDGQSEGYLAEKGRGLENHFFGTPFKDARSAQEFFKRVDFGAEGKAKCKRHPMQ